MSARNDRNTPLDRATTVTLIGPGSLAAALLAGSLLQLSSCCEEPGSQAGADHSHRDESVQAIEHHDEVHHDELHLDEVHLDAAAIAANGIRIERVARHELQPTFRVPAEIAFNRDGMAHVGSPVRGRVAELRVKLGDGVQAGDALLVIESPELGEAQSDYLQEKSAVETAGPAVLLAKNAYERGRGLYEETQGLPLAEVQKRELEYLAAQAAEQAARAARQAAENKLLLLGMTREAVARLAESGEIDPRFTVRASIAGQVIEREVTLGELVGPERDALLVLADVSKLWVLADVPEAKLGETVLGARARVLLGAEQDHWCEGVVSFISPALDPSTRSLRVRIEALDLHPELRPGVFAQADISSGGHAAGETVLAIPEAALRDIEGATCVFVPVAGGEGTFARRNVRVGRAVGGLVPVLSGLTEGEAYVAAGSFILEADLGKASAEHGH